MPELPEVETVRRGLELVIVGKKIKDIQVYYPKIIRSPQDTEQFKFLLIGQVIQSIGRRGKYLLFHLTDDTLVSHLRMEGKYIYTENPNEPYDKHTHVIFSFTDGSQLRYRDVRKFGTMDVVKRDGETELEGIKKLGQEPIDPEFNLERFKKQVKQRMAPIKQILLNQEIISGLGNIYVDDSLALSKIHPLRSGKSLTDDEIANLIMSMKQVLEKAIEKGGSTIRSFESFYGRGSMQDHLIVYGRTGKPCIVCGTPIEKIRVAGRGTHFCPHCQKAAKE
ncbi:DNA-formamidopyrimidine glycosylase [Tepidibacillus fermentans]|uniref:Formamidopyrimidine-DNA glycosylase n=1 Tax=Tepidibacillus fermentans TaxID=1281767 RepID=A0A4R3KIX3_9BACI|nr:DNA-formamidopyrimidine glycosylase [Tepidibacillus fermentans]TCS83563.1 DNA-(apurinic or apyrimidinic site) lyase [Tepidibacillus fermentans]